MYTVYSRRFLLLMEGERMQSGKIKEGLKERAGGRDLAT